LPAVGRHQFVFLAGLHRSGTTLLARLLAAHPEMSGFSGTGVPADEGQHLQSVYPAAKKYGGPGRFGFAPESHLTEGSPLVSEASARKLFEEWSAHWDLSRPLLLEKSPPNLLKTRFLQALLFGVASTDALTFLSVVTVLCVVALAACYIPARRAMKVEPIAALRYE